LLLTLQNAVIHADPYVGLLSFGDI